MLSHELALILLILLICIFNQNKYYNISTLVIYAFIFRLILIIIDLYIYKIPFSSLDSGGFELKAAIWSEFGFNYSISNFFAEGMSFTYSNFLSLFYAVVGRSIFLAKLLSLLVSLLSIILFYSIVKMIWKNNTQAIVASVLFAFMPLYSLISILTLRESYIILILLSSVYLYLVYEEKNNIIFFYFSIFTSFFHIFLHGPMVIIIFTLITCFYISNIYKILTKNYINLISFVYSTLFLILLILLIFFNQITIEIPYIGKISNINSVLEIMQNHFNNTTYGRTAYSQIFYPDSYLMALLLTPIRLVNFLCGPIYFSSVVDILISLDSVVYIFLFFLIMKNINKVFRNSNLIYLIIIFLPIIVIYSWGINNYGTAVRHKTKFLPIIIIISSPYLYILYTKIINKIKKHLSYS
jgi:4-amino-4-deoxy-L-arabinose transferase-like glycosyltransferase